MLNDHFRRLIASACRDVVFVDITETLNNPVRGGVQRTAIRLLADWPGRAARAFCIRDDGTIALLSPAVVDFLVDFFASDRTVAEADRVAAHAATGTKSALLKRAAQLEIQRFAAFPDLVVQPDAFLSLNPIIVTVELFFDPRRIAFYRRAVEALPDRVFLYNHDFLPFLHPEIDPNIDFALSPGMMQYLHLMRSCDQLAFNSEATRSDFLTVISPGSARHHPVYRPGADGLGTARPDDSVGARGFVVLGAVEQRKNTMLVLRAFKRVLETHPETSVTFIGKLVRLSAEDRKEFESSVRTDPRIQWIDDGDDDIVRDLILASRATIFVSPLEGFGIPPLESLALGVPTIVHRGLPSLERLPTDGQLRLSDLDAELEPAITSFLDDGFYLARRAEIAKLVLPTWKDFADGIVAWIGTVRRAAMRPGSDLAPARRHHRILSDFNAIQRLDREAAIIAFYDRLLGRRPTGEEFSSWLATAERFGTDNRRLFLAILALHGRTEALSDAMAEDVMCSALDLGQHYPDWLAFPPTREVADHALAAMAAVTVGSGLSPTDFATALVFAVGRYCTPDAAEVPLPSDATARVPELIRNELSRLVAPVESRIDYALVADSLHRTADWLDGEALPPIDFIYNCYRHLLGRDADPSGLTTFLPTASDGGKRWDVFLNILTSSECGERGFSGEERVWHWRLGDACRHRSIPRPELISKLQSALAWPEPVFARAAWWALGGAAPAPLRALAGAPDGEGKAALRLAYLWQLVGIAGSQSLITPDEQSRLEHWLDILGGLELGLIWRDRPAVAGSLAKLGWDLEASRLVDAPAGWDEIGTAARQALGSQPEDPGLTVKILTLSRFRHSDAVAPLTDMLARSGAGTPPDFLSSSVTDPNARASALRCEQLAVLLRDAERLEPDSFLAQLYPLLLQRPPDPTGIAHFGDALAAGQQPTAIAEAIMASQEYHARSWDVWGFIAVQHLQSQAAERADQPRREKAA